MAGRKRSSDANVIDDRSGFKIKHKDAVKEPGTGYLVHSSESDGEYNLVDHPVNHVNQLVKFGDPFPIEDVRLENYSNNKRDSLINDWPIRGTEYL